MEGVMARWLSNQQPHSTPNLRKMVSIRHHLVKALCSKFKPTKAVKANHHSFTKMGLACTPKAKDNKTKKPATKRTICQDFMVIYSS
jgi:hypothetical protein